MDYRDFTIDLRSTAGGGFEAAVAEAPLRDAPWVPFSAPIEREVLDAMFAAFERPGEVIRRDGIPASVSPRTLGEPLFGAVFKDGLGELYRQSRAFLTGEGRAGLRVRLRFRPDDDPQAAYLASLPWEWMWCPRCQGFLSTDFATPVVRELAVARPGRPLLVDPPLRILVVDAAPRTMHKLNLRLEIERMKEALGSLVAAGQVELLDLEKASLDALGDALWDENEEIHVLHFMGHSGYDEASKNGAIYLEREDGSTQQVDALKLSDWLRRVRGLRLVVLNSCKTARYGGRLGNPLSQGVAAAVLQHTEVPAVIANQFSISDPAAIRFSEILYGRIAAGDGVDEAITEARLRMRGAGEVEWGTPILFLSAPDGKLVTPRKVERAGSIRKLIARSNEVTPVRLGVRSILGWGKDMEERNDKVLDLVECFDDVRYIRNKEWWQGRIFPDLRKFLLQWIDEGRPLVLDLAAHSSIAFAAGWLLEPKSGLDVRVRQRTGFEGELEWHPRDGTEPAGALWQDRRDIEVDPAAKDVAVALAVSQPTVAADVEAYVRQSGLPVGRILDVAIFPEPGGRSVHGGAHSLRLAQALLPRLQTRLPHEREGCVHFFCAAPNALVVYLGQLASSLGKVVLYEHPYKATDAFGRYQRSIELPPPGEERRVPSDF